MRKRGMILILLFLLSLISLNLISAATIELSVTETGGINRINEPVTSGIPMPEGAVFSENNFKLSDGTGNEVPCQFRIESRWNGLVDDSSKSIKWILLDFQTSINAGQIKKFYLDYGAGVSHSAISNMAVIDNSDSIIVNSGKAEFTFTKTGNSMLENVKVNGQDLGGKSIVEALGYGNSTNTNKIYLDKDEGQMFYFKPEEVKVEYLGDMKTVVYERGRFYNESGKKLGREYLYYTVRAYIYKDQGYVLFSVSLTNTGARGWDVTTDIIPRFRYMNINTSVNSGNLDIGFKFMNQNKPASVDIFSGNSLTGIFADDNAYKNPNFCHSSPPREYYELWGGQQKSYKIYYDFHLAGGKDTIVDSVDYPLMALASTRWYSDTKAMGMIAEERELEDNGQNIFYTNDYGFVENITNIGEKFENIQKAKVDVENYGKGTSRYPCTKDVLNSFKYDWRDFGDLGWAQGSCSLHYDWTYSMLLHYLRTGFRRFFDASQPMAMHKYDIDQSHTNRDGPAFNYLSQYENDANCGFCNHNCARPKTTHTWNKGLTYYYLLTGDELAEDASLKIAEGVKGYWFDWGEYTKVGQRNVTHEEIRNQGWSIDNLINSYELTGNQTYLDWAHTIFTNSLLYMDKYNCDDKFFLTNNEFDIILDWPFCVSSNTGLMTGYVAEPLIKLHYYTQDPNVLYIITKLANSVRERSELYRYVGWPNYRDVMSIAYDPENPDPSSGERDYGIMITNIYAYAYLKTGNTIFLDRARNMFWETKNLLQECFRMPDSFSNTETKVHGWSGRADEIYLYMEKYIAENGLINDIWKPEIFNVRANVSDVIFGGRQAFITWETNEPSKTKVEYGLTSSYGSVKEKTEFINYKNTVFDRENTAFHNIILDNLNPGTTYHYRVISEDPAGNIGTSGDLTFTTPSIDTNLPVISKINYYSTAINNLIISWKSDNYLTTEAEYGLTSSYGTIYSDLNYTKAHQIILNNLQERQNYFLKIKSKDGNGNMAEYNFIYNMPSGWKINFQKRDTYPYDYYREDTPVPYGYLPDSGEKYNPSRGYGWVGGKPLVYYFTSEACSGFDFMHQTWVNSYDGDANWSMDLQNGDYIVNMTLRGCWGYSPSHHKIIVEDNVVLDGNVAMYSNLTVPVKITDGNLNITLNGDLVALEIIPTNFPSCSEQQGTICQTGYSCSTGFIPASDTTRCCLGSCVEVRNPGDVNRDLKVNFLDLFLLAVRFNSANNEYDLTGDGVIGIDDLLQVVKNWGKNYT